MNGMKTRNFIWAALVLAMALVAGPVAAKPSTVVFDFPLLCPPYCG